MDALPVIGLFFEAETHEREDLISETADPVLGLPQFAALDTGSDVANIVPAKSDDEARIRFGWWVELPVVAEEDAEAGAARSEIGLRRD